jgi:Tfp pilus assembly protein PilN
MHNINLLPWREINRKNRKKQEWVLLVMSVVLFLGFILLVHHCFVKDRGEKSKILPHLSSRPHFKWIGYLRSENNYLAFLQDQKGNMFSVQVGSEVGGARVIQINESGVLLVRNQKQEWVSHVI